MASEAGLTVLDPKGAGHLEVVGHVVTEDLERALGPGACGHGCTRRPAHVGVVEVGEPVGSCPHLAAHPTLLPGQQRLVRAKPGEQGANGLAVADDDAVDTAHLAGLRADTEPAGRADQGECGLRAGAADLEG
jgi:hypothetical protein